MTPPIQLRLKRSHSYLPQDTKHTFKFEDADNDGVFKKNSQDQILNIDGTRPSSEQLREYSKKWGIRLDRPEGVPMVDLYAIDDIAEVMKDQTIAANGTVLRGGKFFKEMVDVVQRATVNSGLAFQLRAYAFMNGLNDLINHHTTIPYQEPASRGAMLLEGVIRLLDQRHHLWLSVGAGESVLNEKKILKSAYILAVEQELDDAGDALINQSSKEVLEHLKKAGELSKTAFNKFGDGKLFKAQQAAIQKQRFENLQFEISRVLDLTPEVFSDKICESKPWLEKFELFNLDQKTLEDCSVLDDSSRAYCMEGHLKELEDNYKAVDRKYRKIGDACYRGELLSKEYAEEIASSFSQIIEQYDLLRAPGLKTKLRPQLKKILVQAKAVNDSLVAENPAAWVIRQIQLQEWAEKL